MAVYFISQVENDRVFTKIGRARNIEKRRRDLQTGNPVALAVVGWINAADDHALERALHAHFATRRLSGEWFAIEPADALPMLSRAGVDGYVAKNTDAFEITGYDRDAVPEYLGVWEWGDLELEECCPFCGCMCGMHFQEASWMYHCMACDALTDFSELDREHRHGAER
ncbi:GIY-YIG nuclease family protein [Roseomonas aeriglobus]|nr:GIY-YIG nuclease family protein [Roseomonas aeriglobus]USU06599.1 GIY-YIG nuclease family protein [Sphingomonadaceae bacterium OTU29LAMAA1]